MAEPARIENLETAEAIETAAQWCMERGLSPSKVITDDTLEMLSTEAFRSFARSGWEGMVNDALHRARSVSEGDEDSDSQGGTVVHARHGRNSRLWESPLDMMLVGAASTLKRFRDFGVADLEDFAGRSKSQRMAWTRREKWAKRMTGLLEQHKATTVGALPKTLHATVENETRKAFAR